IVSVTEGYSGAAVVSIPDGGFRAGQYIVHLEIPDSWNDLQVADFIFKMTRSDKNVSRLFSQWIPQQGYDASEIQLKWQKEHVAEALQEAGQWLETYVKTFVSLIPGGGAALAVYDLGEGNYTDAAWDVLFLIPGDIVAKGLQKAGGLVIKAG